MKTMDEKEIFKSPMEQMGEEITKFARTFRKECQSLNLKECKVEKPMGTIYGMDFKVVMNYKRPGEK